MAKTVFVGLFSLITLGSYARVPDTTAFYINQFGKFVIKKDSSGFVIKLILPKKGDNEDLPILQQFYHNGKIHFTVFFSKMDTKSLNNGYYTYPVFQGQYISFYPNGKKNTISNYEKGIAVGSEIKYFPNGKLYNVKTIKQDKTILYSECHDQDGTILTENGIGHWKEYMTDSFGDDYIEGEVKDSLQQGTWHKKRNGANYDFSTYKDGNMLSGYQVDSEGNKTYYKCDVIPDFNGGIEVFFNFLAKNIRYPSVARENNTQGRIIISFIVDIDGTLTNIKVVRGIGDGCDEEALRVIKLSSPWKPGVVDGKPVRVTYSVPISFSIKDLTNRE
jgi:TonB family protein